MDEGAQTQYAGYVVECIGYDSGQAQGIDMWSGSQDLQEPPEGSVNSLNI